MNNVTNFVNAIAVAACLLLVSTCALGQASRQTVLLQPQRSTVLRPACTVNQLQLRFRTGGDDLRGGKNNLNVEADFADGNVQQWNNVNQGAGWGNNTSSGITISLKQPVAPSQITKIRLAHLASGSFAPPNANQAGLLASPSGPALAPIYLAQAGQSEDNWDMAQFQAFGVSNGGALIPIASFGAHRFTGSNPTLDVSANSEVGCPSRNQVTKISFTFQTADDDLRGGNDNLNVWIAFAGGKKQFEPNVNHSQNWPNGSARTVEVFLNQPVTIDELREVTLADTFGGGSGGDNWNMASMQADAYLADGSRHTIAKYGFHRFSADRNGSNSSLISIAAHAIN